MNILFSVGILPEVASLSRDDLEDLLACDDKLTEFVEGLPQVAALRNQCEQLSAQNEALASMRLIWFVVIDCVYFIVFMKLLSIFI